MYTFFLLILIAKPRVEAEYCVSGPRLISSATQNVQLDSMSSLILRQEILLHSFATK